MSKQTTKEKIVVIYDTFCGWCYGAAPVFDALVENGTDVEALHGHIFNAKNSPKMSEGKGSQILETIPHIESLTGQVFSDEFKTQIANSDTEVLESGLSAQAAALVHEQGAKKEFELRHRLEKLHFGEGISSNNRAAIIEAAVASGVKREEAKKIGTNELAKKAAKQTERARKLMAVVGSRGVPTVLKIKDDTITPIDHQAFYGKAETIVNSLNTI